MAEGHPGDLREIFVRTWNVERRMSLIVKNRKVQLAIKIEGKAKKGRTDVSEADWRRKEAQKAIEDMRIQKELLGGDPW